MEVMVACVDAQRETYGVESICAHVPIAPSTYWRLKAQQADPTRRSVRAQRDDALRPCPSGWTSQGNYCVSQTANPKMVIPKNGSCPSGWNSQGNYCISQK